MEFETFFSRLRGGPGARIASALRSPHPPQDHAGGSAPNSHEEAELIARCLSRQDDHAWELFVRRYSRLVWSSVHRAFRAAAFPYCHEDAEDVWSRIFLSLIDHDFRKLRQFKSRNASTLSTWLTVVTVNQTIDFMRREKGRSRTAPHDTYDAAGELIDSRQDIEAVFMEQERDSAIRSAVTDLPDRDRQVYELLYNKGLVPEEAARHLGITLSALYTRKHRLIEKIKKSFPVL